MSVLLDPNSLGEVFSAKAWTLQCVLTTSVTKLHCEPGRYWIRPDYLLLLRSLTKWVEISCWLLCFSFVLTVV